MDEKFSNLSELRAGDFEHLDGSLIDHLTGTKALLKEWKASSELQSAGLYHAAYGTAGFEGSLVTTDQRNKIASIIRTDAEELVYQYCACDRKHFFSQFDTGVNPIFKNRFTGELYYLSSKAMKMFCELTAANETEIAIDNPLFVTEQGEELCSLFDSMSPYLSKAAQNQVVKVFGGKSV